jgi:hypothetical protein
MSHPWRSPVPPSPTVSTPTNLRSRLRVVLPVLLLVPLLVVTGCRSDPNVAAAAELRARLERDLKEGASPAEVEGFLKRNGLPCSWVEFTREYMCRIESSEWTDWKGIESVIMVRIYMNAAGTLERAEVFPSYTWF